jgi:hypothetical protein
LKHGTNFATFLLCLAVKFADGKCIDADEWSSLEAQAAFLGPNIWDKSTGFENELQLGDQVNIIILFRNGSAG